MSELGDVLELLHGADDRWQTIRVVDAERGVLLREVTRLDRQVVTARELSEVAFDDEIFRFVSPDSQSARPKQLPVPGDAVLGRDSPPGQLYSLCAPGRLPHSWAVEASYLGRCDRPARGNNVYLSVHSGDGQSRLSLTETAEPEPNPERGEPVEVNGRRTTVTTEPIGGGWIATTEFTGTHVYAQGNLDRDSLLEIVANLKPAETAIPPMTDR